MRGPASGIRAFLQGSLRRERPPLGSAYLPPVMRKSTGGAGTHETRKGGVAPVHAPPSRACPGTRPRAIATTVQKAWNQAPSALFHTRTASDMRKMGCAKGLESSPPELCFHARTPSEMRKRRAQRPPRAFAQRWSGIGDAQKTCAEGVRDGLSSPWRSGGIRISSDLYFIR